MKRPSVDPIRRTSPDTLLRHSESGSGPGRLQPALEPGVPASAPRTVQSPARSQAAPTASPARDASVQGLQQAATQQMRRALGIGQGAPSLDELARALRWLGADTPAGRSMQSVHDSYLCLRRGRSGWISG